MVDRRVPVPPFDDVEPMSVPWGPMLVVYGVGTTTVAMLGAAYTTRSEPWTAPGEVVASVGMYWSTWVAAPGVAPFEALTYGGAAVTAVGAAYWTASVVSRARRDDADSPGTESSERSPTIENDEEGSLDLSGSSLAPTDKGHRKVSRLKPDGTLLRAVGGRLRRSVGAVPGWSFVGASTFRRRVERDDAEEDAEPGQETGQNPAEEGSDDSSGDDPGLVFGPAPDAENVDGDAERPPREFPRRGTVRRRGLRGHTDSDDGG